MRGYRDNPAAGASTGDPGTGSGSPGLQRRDRNQRSGPRGGGGDRVAPPAPRVWTSSWGATVPAGLARSCGLEGGRWHRVPDQVARGVAAHARACPPWPGPHGGDERAAWRQLARDHVRHAPEPEAPPTGPLALDAPARDPALDTVMGNLARRVFRPGPDPVPVRRNP